MDRKITIQEQVEGHSTEFNVGPITWTNVATNVCSKVIEHPGSQQYEADRLTSTQVLIFQIRYRSGLKRNMRIVYNDENYLIVGINEPKGFRRQLLDLRAELTVEE
jgi:SPP1 family predicted phage head-tail adaptor